MKHISILGSTGSIGTQTLEVVRQNGDVVVDALAAGSNISLLFEQIKEFRPKMVCVFSEEKAKQLKEILLMGEYKTEVVAGMDGLIACATIDSAQMVVTAFVGMIGIRPTIEAIKAGKDIALANKETLVAGGNIVMKAVREKGVRLIPVDSEHSAIFQCLNFDLNAKFKKLILTASGGAFRNFSKQEVASLKAQEALKHPNWLMGKKITIDCATLLNKGLEVIEACHLYNAPLSKVEAIVHPESIIHSMVEFDDGAVMAQLGFPSMEIPIQLALTYPERLNTNVPLLELAGKSLTFGKIDEDKYPCFSLALKSFEMGDNYACAMNAANEAAVGLYLEDRIGFYDISDLIEHVLGKTQRLEVTRESLLYTDRLARELVYQKVGVKN